MFPKGISIPMYYLPTSGFNDTQGLQQPDYGANVGSNALRGLSAGASIGSAFSPIGTVIGAGIGALGGAAYGLFDNKQQRSQYDNDLVRQSQAEAATNYMKQRQQGISALDSFNSGVSRRRIGYTDMFNI